MVAAEKDDSMLTPPLRLGVRSEVMATTIGHGVGAGCGGICQGSANLPEVKEKRTSVLGRKGPGRRVRMKGAPMAQRKDLGEGWAGC